MQLFTFIINTARANETIFALPVIANGKRLGGASADTFKPWYLYGMQISRSKVYFHEGCCYSRVELSANDVLRNYCNYKVVTDIKQLCIYLHLLLQWQYSPHC